MDFEKIYPELYDLVRAFDKDVDAIRIDSIKLILIKGKEEEKILKFDENGRLIAYGNPKTMKEMIKALEQLLSESST